jgi:hypothetical protein
MKPQMNNVSQKTRGMIIPVYNKCFVFILYIF